MNSDQQQQEKLQRLLRLKRYEQPPEGFAEEFLEKFQRRQRSEILRRCTWSIVGERLQTFLQTLRRPAVLWSAGGAYAAVLVTLWLLPRPSQPGNATIVVTGGTVATGTLVDDRPGGHPVSAPVNPIPGKRRTTEQDQEKAPLIGLEEREKQEDDKLRDF